MSTFAELKRQVQLRLGDNISGKTVLAIEQAINDAQMAIASIRDFDELITLDTTHALTVDGTKSYHITTDLLLVRPKDIYSIRYMDTDLSRKLIYVSPRELDEKIPYTEIVGEGRPTYYTRRGMYIELFRIPDVAKSLYIQHSQWPALLSADTDETPFINIDPVIVSLSTDIAQAILEGVGGGQTGWAQRAQQLLGMALKEDAERPDRTFVAQPFNPSGAGPVGEYWDNPFYKG